jgi:hypothetical protein
MAKKIFPGVESYKLNEDGSFELPFLGGGGWNDYVISGLSLPLAHVNAPTLTLFRDGLYLPAFVGTGIQSQYVYAAIHIQHDYLPGTPLYPHVHWTHINAAPTGSVKWQIEYSVSKGHSVGTFGASTTVSVVQAAAAQYTHHIAEVADGDVIPATNVEPDSVVLIRLIRDPADAADDFADDAYLVAIDLHYKSQMCLTNEKASPFTPYKKL